MAQIFKCNVYLINNQNIVAGGTPVLMGFPSNGVILRAADAATKSSLGVDLYGIVQTIPTGLNVGSNQYYAVETVAALQTLANA